MHFVGLALPNTTKYNQCNDLLYRLVVPNLQKEQFVSFDNILGKVSKSLSSRICVSTQKNKE